ncbi:hypothetical protein OH492_14960 [Vibrio chagasii]|nr:hypothetical protein [Vibrio chagasii]
MAEQLEDDQRHIGTAIVEAKPVTIIGERHGYKHRFIGCFARPVFDHQGQMVGVLDITSEQQQHDSSELKLLIPNISFQLI